METGITKQQILTQLTRSPHGKLEEYLPLGRAATLADPEFMAHLIAWNERQGQIRDSKVALPVATLGVGSDFPFRENSIAHLALRSPRELVVALRFARGKTPGHYSALRKMTRAYLDAREGNEGWLTRSILQHRVSMKELYALNNFKPGELAKAVLFEGKKPGVFAEVAQLGGLSDIAAAAIIINRRLPFLVVKSALGKRLESPDLLLALIGQMSPAELMNHSKLLEKLGVTKNPATRGAYAEALAKAAESKKVAPLKATKAAAAVSDAKLASALQGAQERQLDAIAIKGNWLVLGDKSSSMQVAIESARVVAATLARLVEGEVRLVFFDTLPRALNVTGKDYDKILAETKAVNASGATSIGVGLDWALKNDVEVDGIAIVSDGAENTPPYFADTLKRYQQKLGKEIPTYLYWVPCYQPNFGNNNPGQLAAHMAASGLSLDVFDLRGGVDYYSLPNLAKTMRANRYSLIDEVLATPLLSIADALKAAKQS